MPSKPCAPRTFGFAVGGDTFALGRDLIGAGASVDNYGSDTPADVTPLQESVDELELVVADRRSSILPFVRRRQLRSR
jgi:hypothetical protein